MLLTTFYLASCTHIENGTYIVVEGVIDPIATEDITDNLLIGLEVSYDPQRDDGSFLPKRTIKTRYYPLERDFKSNRFQVQIPIKDYRAYVSNLRLRENFKIILKQTQVDMEQIEVINYYDDLKKSPQDSARFKVLPRYEGLRFSGVIELDTLRISNIY